MTNVDYLYRDVTKEELGRVQEGFRDHGREFGVPPHDQERHTVVAMNGKDFIGCASGLRDNNWFYLSDLWLEKEFRKSGMGRKMLSMLEDVIKQRGYKHIYTWTAGYEAPGFYQKQGYTIFAEHEDYYVSGHSRIGLRKDL